MVSELIRVTPEETERFARECKDFNPLHSVNYKSRQVVPGDLLVSLYVFSIPESLKSRSLSYSFDRPVKPGNGLIIRDEGIYANGRKVVSVAENQSSVGDVCNDRESLGSGLEKLLSDGAFLSKFSGKGEELDYIKSGLINQEEVFSMLETYIGGNQDKRGYNFAKVFLNMTPLGYKLQTLGKFKGSEDQVPIYKRGGLVQKNDPFSREIDLNSLDYGVGFKKEGKRDVVSVWVSNEDLYMYKDFVLIRGRRKR